MFVAAPATHFDLFTTKVMASVTMLVVSVATLLASRNTRQVPALTVFALGLLAVSIGTVLALARVFIPGTPIILVCNACMVGGQITVVRAIREFRGQPSWPGRVTAGFCVIVAAPFLWWLYADERFDIRVGIISLAFAILSADAAQLAIRRVSRGERLLYWPAGFAFALAAGVYSIRGAAAFGGYYGKDLLAPVPIELVTSICAPVSYILCALGMVLASATILRYDAESMALRDPLTNLPNRRLFLDRLGDAERRARASDLMFGLVYLDLDGLKQVNDIMGHEAGDLLLKNVGAILVRSVRARDCLARIGGDEFVVLIEEVHDRREVEAIAEKIKLAVGTERIGDDRGTFASVSCGVAVFPKDGAAADAVLRKADAAMYAAKQRRAANSGPATESLRKTHRAGNSP